MDKKIFSKIYLGCAICFSLLYVFVAQFESNVTGSVKIILIVVGILFDLFLYLMSYLYSNWKITVENEEIIYQSMLKKTKRICFSNISSIIKDEYGNLIIYDGENVFIKLSKLDGYWILEENLKAHGIKIKNASNSTSFVMESTRLYYGLDICCIVVAMFILGLSLYYHYMTGCVLFGAMLLLSVIQFLCRIFNKTKVCGTVITCYRFMRKPKVVKFTDIKYIKRKEFDNAEYIYLYLWDNSKIKISKLQKNTELFEDIVRRQKWKSC